MLAALKTLGCIEEGTVFDAEHLFGLLARKDHLACGEQACDMS